MSGSSILSSISDNSVVRILVSSSQPSINIPPSSPSMSALLMRSLPIKMDEAALEAVCSGKISD